MLAAIWANTQDEVRKADLLTILFTLGTVLTLWPDDIVADLAERQRQEITEVRSQLQSLTDEIIALQEAEGSRDEQFLEGLERSVFESDTVILRD